MSTTAGKQQSEIRATIIPIGSEADQEAKMVDAIRWLLEQGRKMQRQEGPKCAA